MIRVFFASLGVAVLIGVIFGIPGAIVPIFVVLFVLIAANNIGKLKCPYCGKRVKIGAGVCHHCGRDVKSYAMRLVEKRQAGQPAAAQNVLPPPSSVSTAERMRRADGNRFSPTANYCCSCGAALHSGARFCSGCGEAVSGCSPSRELKFQSSPRGRLRGGHGAGSD
jgi:predicted amidophosphoribosyltransferase